MTLRTLGAEEFVLKGHDIKPFFIQMKKMEGKIVNDVKDWVASNPEVGKIPDNLDELKQSLAHAVSHEACQRLESMTTALSSIARGGKDCSWRGDVGNNPTFEIVADKAVSIGVSPLGSTLHSQFQALQKELLQISPAPRASILLSLLRPL